MHCTAVLTALVVATTPTPKESPAVKTEITLPHATITMAEFELMKKSVLFGAEDEKYLRLSREVLADQTEQVLDVWYGFIGSSPQLVATFGDKSGTPNPAYLQAVRKRFNQWILDTAAAKYDQTWLDTQWEIGLRHHRTKKNQTDHVSSSSAIVPFRYLAPLVYPVTATLKPFLAKKGHSAEDVEKMHAAWVKSLLLQVTLWSHPYIKPGDY